MASREENRRLAEAYAEAMGIGDTNLHDDDGRSRRLHSRLRRLSGLRYALSVTPMATDTPQVRKWLTSRSAPGTRRNTRRRAGVIRVWPRDR